VLILYLVLPSMAALRRLGKRGQDCAASLKRRSIGASRRAAFLLPFGLLLLIPAISSVGEETKKNHPLQSVSDSLPAVLWIQPASIANRDLFHGPGGREHEPHTSFTFLREDRKGTNPKFDVLDEDGTKWRVKLGAEARPEIAASRLLWAIGYFATEDYFLPDLRVKDMKGLKRGRHLQGPDGSIKNVRLKRFLPDEKKVGSWRWRSNPFVGTREFNGLRVMMALMNSWDLKDENNSVYQAATGAGAPELHYMVSDLGATFGTTGLSRPGSSSKGDLAAYARSKFIKKVSAHYVDFNVPTRPNLWRLVNLKEFVSRVRLEWIGRHVPRADARWVGDLLSQLSRDQVRQAFQAAGYSPDDADRFTDVVEERTEELKSP
jgi:hypothetical protein